MLRINFLLHENVSGCSQDGAAKVKDPSVTFFPLFFQRFPFVFPIFLNYMLESCFHLFLFSRGGGSRVLDMEERKALRRVSGRKFIGKVL